MITPIGSEVTAERCTSSSTRLASAWRLSNPVNGSITASVRCSRCRTASVQSTESPRRSQGDRSRAGRADRRTRRAASTAKTTASSVASVATTPIVTPRVENRALRVTTGIANHAIAGDSTPPVIATLAAISTTDPYQPANSTFSGLGRTLGSGVGDLEEHSGDHQHDQRPPAQPWNAQRQADTASSRSAIRRSGSIRASMSSMRSRSMPSRISQESAIPNQSAASERKFDPESADSRN